jgi:hypothetical protein
VSFTGQINFSTAHHLRSCLFGAVHRHKCQFQENRERTLIDFLGNFPRPSCQSGCQITSYLRPIEDFQLFETLTMYAWHSFEDLIPKLIRRHPGHFKQAFQWHSRLFKRWRRFYWNLRGWCSRILHSRWPCNEPPCRSSHFSRDVPAIVYIGEQKHTSILPLSWL